VISTYRHIRPANTAMLTILVTVAFALALAPSAPAQQALPPAAAATAGAATPSADAADAIAAMLPEAMERLHVPGVVVGIVQGGEVRYLQGFGWADVHARKPIDASSTLMRVGSVSKLLIAVAVAREVEAGRLEMTAPVNRYLSAFKLPSFGAQEITVEHLLTHTAGFDEDIVNLTRRPGGADESLGDYLAASVPALIRRPGQVIQYSNYGMALAAHIVELVSKQDFRSYVSRHILGPLAMNSSTFSEPHDVSGSGANAGAAASALAGSFHFAGSAYVSTPYLEIRPYPAGSLLATAADMCKFILAMLPSGEGGGVVSSDSLAAMQAKRFANYPQLPGIGMAWFVGSRNGAVVASHGGNIWDFSSELLLLPEHDFGVFISGNGAQAGRLIDEAIDAIFASAFPAPELVGGPNGESQTVGARTGVAEAGRAYSGVYRLNRYPRRGPGKISAMFMENRARFSDDGTRLTLSSGAGASFPEVSAALRPDGVYESADDGEFIAFKTATPGQPALMLVGLWAFEKLAWYETGGLWLWLFGACAGVFVVTLIAGLARAFSALRGRFRHSPSLFVTHVALGLRPSLAPAALMSLLDLGVLSANAWALAAMPQWEALQLLPQAERAFTIALAAAQLPALGCIVQLLSARGRHRRARRSTAMGFGRTARWSADYATASTASPALSRRGLCLALLAHVVFTAGAVYWGIVRLP